ncbi:uncharacterized protein PV09_00071 [Verruconis gallopava]|uniref:Peptidase S33 tripeptidyl aminopeptidase-like C-terminal domain-containing protein n=1 Tax=Verruconis gallopava TaxID=253628 RepID=A0A0D2AR08_9PEZI|nr:uncharacterized protein PV09_00071 [Verruconis gallopava]KIW09133.1 hypothetical protein PV09_00071 [Verruconis gallopava]
MNASFLRETMTKCLYSLGLSILHIAVQALADNKPIFIRNAANLGAPKEFPWDDIVGSPFLDWHECYDSNKFQCARLILPLDWKNESNPNNISLALIRLPAKVPYKDPSHGGTIITNPGGPGGSGVCWVLENAEKLQYQLDGPKHYEILSFDPRGVFNSRPNAYCFKSAVESEIWYDQKEAVGRTDSGNYALKYNWAAEMARGELCATTENGKYPNGDNIRQYVSTASVARDMLEITRLLELEKARDKKDIPYEASTQQPLQRDISTYPGKLQYFGTSYGTFLGQTFASMFPQHVGRMVLDANVDPDNWVSRYEAGIDDHNKIRKYFFERCFDVKGECPFRRDGDASAADVEERFNLLLDSLDEFPQYATGLGRAMPITRTVVEMGFLTATYQPLFFFKPYARFLNDLLLNVNPGIPFWDRPVPTEDTFTDKMLQQKYQGEEVGPAVHCSDGPLLSGEPLSAFEGYVSNLTARFGSIAAGLQADYKIPCWTWPRSLRTKWRYPGPFGGDVQILFVNNRLDPVTSIKNAVKMSSRFNGSVLLEQNSAGHGALWPPSECMWSHVRNYINTGQMPPKGTICEPLCIPFNGMCEGVDTGD